MSSEPKPPKFSVILPSYNGEDTLPKCLEALADLLLPDDGAEFLFVNNRSTDATAMLLADAAEALQGVVLSEDRPGKSFALNTAIAAARGEFLVFTDDDTIVDPTWLQAYAAAVAAHPRISVFAGQIRPCWVGGVPHWLDGLANGGHVGGCTAVDRGEGPIPAYGVKGANVMVRRMLLLTHGFDTDGANFGASTNASSVASGGGGDTKLMRELVEAGEQIFYLPGARLSHIVQPYEATLSFILRRQMRIGRGDANAETKSVLNVLRKGADIVAYVLFTPLLLLAGRKVRAAQQVMKAARKLGILQVLVGGSR